MAVINLTNDNFNEVLNSDNLIVVDFYADWCGPCRMLSPIIAELSDKYSDIVFGKVNVDNEELLARKYNITGIPNIIIFKDGDIVNNIVGLRSKEEIENIINRV